MIYHLYPDALKLENGEMHTARALCGALWERAVADSIPPGPLCSEWEYDYEPWDPTMYNRYRTISNIVVGLIWCEVCTAHPAVNMAMLKHVDV